MSNCFIADDILALNKPFGMGMTRTGTDPKEDLHTIQKYLPFLARASGVQDIYPVHRLDKSTSGVLLFAKTRAMRIKLVDLFRRRMVDKRYWAIVRGVPEPTEGERKTYLFFYCPFYVSNYWF